ncbi:MAG: hypothetical protein Kow00120_29720 [Anaerolineae bacterium]
MTLVAGLLALATLLASTALAAVQIARAAAAATPTATPPYKPSFTPQATATLPALLAPTLRPTATPFTPTPTPTETPGPTPDRTARNVRVPILMYHYVSTPPEGSDNYRVGLSVTPDQFREQMRYLTANGYHAVTLDDVIYALAQGRALPPKPVVLTFDDGYRDAYENAFPILQEFGLIGTFFVVTGWIDEQNPDYLSWAQAREMVEAGMRIEPHSKSHPDLRDKPYDYIVYEVYGAIESIEAHTGYRPRFFCYPAGAFDDNLVAALPDFGLWGAVTTQQGTRHYSDQPYLMKRVRISSDTTLAQFASFLEWGSEGDE